MVYEVVSRRTTIDKNGNDKTINEKFIIENAELCSECEHRILEEYNGENTCVSIKESPIKEFVNQRSAEDEHIFFATIEDIFIKDDGDESSTKYVVGLFETTIERAMKVLLDYLKQGMNDFKVVCLKKTKIIDVLK